MLLLLLLLKLDTELHVPVLWVFCLLPVGSSCLLQGAIQLLQPDPVYYTIPLPYGQPACLTLCLATCLFLCLPVCMPSACPSACPSI